MLLTITYAGNDTQDIGYLLYKNPYRAQEFRMKMGKAYAFYPEVSDERTTFALLLELDPIDLAKGKEDSGEAGLFAYVNDRPYVTSSFMSTALVSVLGKAMSGNCVKRQELADSRMDLEARLTMLPVKGNKEILRQMFEPLGYEVAYETFPIDEDFPEWGESPYVNLTLKGRVRLSDLLNQLYVLIPVSDVQKHYYVSENEIEKLADHGGEWIKSHPYREMIVRRYFPKTKSYARKFNELIGIGVDGESSVNEPEDISGFEPLDTIRLETVRDEVLRMNAASVIDIGCGEGKLLSLLLQDRGIAKLAGADVSLSALDKAKKRLGYDELKLNGDSRLELFQGSLLYKDSRFEHYDCACLVEVVEHIDEARLPEFEKVFFGYAIPRTVILTTPNREYNKNYEHIGENGLRHSDHRFEWTGAEFRAWTEHICEEYGYSVEIKGIGEKDDRGMSPTQMGVFRK